MICRSNIHVLGSIVHQPRLIVTKIPWVGSREHRWIINAIQEKYYYIHVLGKWYPTDFQPTETKKRALRSNGGGEDPDMTINQFFNIVENGTSPLKRLRKLSRKIVEPLSAPDDKRPRGMAQQRSAILPQSTFVDRVTPKDKVVDESSATIPRSSGRVKRKMSPPKRVPRVLTETSSIAIEKPSAELLSTPTFDILLSSSHSRNRSTSQSSEQTIVAEGTDSGTRSSSVESTKTAVASLPSKKRKAEILDEHTDLGPPSPKRMTTRNRSGRIARTYEPVPKKVESSTSPTDSQAKSIQAKGKSKK